jgi:O-antigen ligase
MGSKKFIFTAGLLALLAFAIPIEYKYDKLFRFFSLSLIPQGIEIPSSFDKKIYFYPSDIAALLLLIAAIFWFRTPLSRLLLQRGSVYLWTLFGCSLVSILASSFADYPVIYIRLWQLLTPLLLFSFINAAIEEEDKPRLIRIVLSAIVLAALFQTAVAIVQYFTQDWLGLRMLCEQKTRPGFGIWNGSRWIFDRIFNRIAPTTLLLRSSGTLLHPNVLGGFLSVSILASYALMMQMGKKGRLYLGLTLPFQFFALAVTYSRSAIFALTLGTFFWFGLQLWERGVKQLASDRAVRFLAGMICLSTVLCGTLLYDQLNHRGGIVNYNPVAQNSDRVRIHYQNVAFSMIEKNPLFGVGFHQFGLRYPSYLPKNDTSNTYLTVTHNIYLLIASESGLIALTAFLLWIGTLLFAALRSPLDPINASLIAIFIAFLFIGACDFYPILSQQGKLLFFCTAGLLAANARQTTTARRAKLVPF